MIPIFEEKKFKEEADIKVEFEDFRINCDSCKENLLDVIKVKSDDKVQQFQAVCPFCGDTTFIRQINGTCWCAPYDGIEIADVQTEVDGTLFKNLIRLINVKK